MAVNLYKLSGEVDVNIGKAEANLKRVDSSVRRTQAGLNQLDGAGKKAGQGVSGGLDRGVSSANRLSSAVSALSGKLSSLKSPNINLGGGGGGGSIFGSVAALTKSNLLTGAITSTLGGISDAMKEGWQIGIEYQKVLENATVRMDRFFSSGAQTKGFVADVEKFAALSPIFEMEEAVTGAQRLLQMKYTAGEVVPELKKIGDIVGGVGGNAETIDRVTKAMSKMVSTGRIQADEMDSLTEANIPAWDLLAKAIGKTTAETRKLSEAGRIDARLGVRGIIAMGGEMFGGQSAKAAQTLSGQESQFKSAMEMQLAKATAGNFDQLKQAYKQGTEGFSSGAAQQFGGEVNKLLTDIGREFTPTLQKFASGEYFTQGFDALVSGRKAKEAFDRGDAGAGLNYGGQAVGRALGAEYGAKGEDKLVDGIVGKMDGIDKALAAPLVRGISGALQTVEKVAKAGGALVGIKTGEGIETGVKDKLEIHSPSKVMERLGADAVEGFNIGFENGKAKIRPITAEDLYRKQYDRADKAGYDDAFDKASKKTGIPANILMAVGSRETNMRNIMGDGGRGAGLMQVDVGTDAAFKSSGAWKDAEASIIRGAEILKEKFDWLTNNAGKEVSVKGNKFTVPKFEGEEKMRVALAMYNSGAWAPYHASKGRSPDFGTTGKDYSADVLKRSEYFGKFLGGVAEAPSLYERAAAAYEAATVKLSSLTDAAMQFVGLGGATAPASALPKAVPPTVAPKALPAVPQSQTVQGGQLATAEVKAKTEMLALSKEATAATVQMQIPLRELPTTATAATEAMKATGSQAGQFAVAITAAGNATGKAVDHLEHFAGAVSNTFDDMLDSLMNGEKMDWKSMGKSLFKGLTSSLISAGTGGKASTPGQALSNALFGSQNQETGSRSGGLFNGGGGGLSGALSAATGGGSVPATPGFAGGGGANDVLGKASGAMDMAQNIGGMLGKGGALSKIPGLAKAGGFLTKLPGVGGMLGKLGGLFGMGGGGAAAGAAGAAGSGAGGGMMGALMPGLMSNPFTAIAGIALAVGVPLLGKLFGKDPLSDYKKHIKSIYGIDVKAKSILGKVMQAGQSKFGAEWEKRKVETVKLPEVRDMLSEYSGAFMKGGNGNLFNSAEYKDQFSAINQIKVKMFNGGVVPGPTRGYDHVPVLMDGGEQVISNAEQRRARGGGRGGMFGTGIDEVLERVAAALNRFEAMPADHVVMTGLEKRPGMAAADVRNDFELRGEHSMRMREIMANR